MQAPDPGARCTTAPDRTLFVVRCAVAAGSSYALALHVGLHHAAWAPVSALVVTQETATATLAAIGGRCLGTLSGLVVAVLVSWIGGLIGLAVVFQISLAAAICGAISIGRPHLRVCLWTCPLVLATSASDAAAVVAVFRASEVLLGAVVGGFLAAMFATVVKRFRPPRTKAPLGEVLAAPRDGGFAR
jgi:uncharacterized membrane protein YccC